MPRVRPRGREKRVGLRLHRNPGGERRASSGTVPVSEDPAERATCRGSGTKTQNPVCPVRTERSDPHADFCRLQNQQGPLARTGPRFPPRHTARAFPHALIVYRTTVI